MKYLIFNTLEQNIKVNDLINDILIRYSKLELKETDLKQVGEYSFICINETINNQIIEIEKSVLNQVNLIYQISLLETKIEHTDNLINNIHIIQTKDKNYLLPSNQTEKEKAFGIQFDLYNYNMYYVNKIIESKDLELITKYKNQIIKTLKYITIKYEILVSDINKNILDLLYVQIVIEDHMEEFKYNTFLQNIDKSFGNIDDDNRDNLERLDYLIKYYIKDYDIKDKNKYYKQIEDYENRYFIVNSYVELYEIVNKDLQQLLIQNKR